MNGMPEFPKNSMGLVRGSVLEALTDKASYIAKKGSKFPIGFDGEYIRCGNNTWGVQDLEEEIKAGIWKITDEVFDLSNKESSNFFAKIVERL